MKLDNHPGGRLIRFLCVIIQVSAAVVSATGLELPCGPGKVARFGGYQTRLEFSPEWDASWRLGPHSDVVIAFPESQARLVFWHGSNYVPCWVNGNGRWFSDGALMRGGAGPHQDRLCRFSFAAVQENSDARVVVRWRYAPVDETGELIHSDPITGWHDWVDEFYTVYPDATGVRSVTLHSSAWGEPYSVQQSIRIRQPGESGLPSETRGSETLNGGLTQWIECGGSMPFHAVAGHALNLPPPASWGEWPARGSAPMAGHDTLGAMEWEPTGKTPTSRSWRMLIGMATRAEECVRVSRSWLSPPVLRIASGDWTSAGYQSDGKAYRLCASKPGGPRRLAFTLEGSPSSPVVNPALVIEGWGRSSAGLVLGGKELPSGADFRYGYRKTVGAADLIVWVRLKTEEPVRFEIRAPEHIDEQSEH